MPNREPYPSSLTEAEWKLIEPLVPGPKLFGRPARYPKRAILDAIFYAVRTGCAWRLLSDTFLPWQAVYKAFSRSAAVGGRCQGAGRFLT